MRFQFMLARDLGVWDVQGMIDAMPLPVYMQWAAFYEADAYFQKEAVKKGRRKK